MRVAVTGDGTDSAHLRPIFSRKPRIPFRPGKEEKKEINKKKRPWPDTKKGDIMKSPDTEVVPESVQWKRPKTRGTWGESPGVRAESRWQAPSVPAAVEQLGGDHRRKVSPRVYAN